MPPTVEPGIDLIVVNYKTYDDLERFVESFIDFPPSYPYSLTIYDVAQQNPNALDRIFDLIHGVRYIFDPTNCGYAAAVNRAAAATGREVIAAFNADTYFTELILDDCYEALMQNKDWGVLGPRQVNAKGQLTHGGIIGTNVNPTLRWWLKSDGDYSRIVDEVVSVSGSAYFTKRTAWNAMTNNPAYRALFPNAVGAFLPTQHYYEETFCSYHARHLGWKVVYYGLATMVHEWHKASPVGSVEKSLLPASQSLFRETCAAMGIECD